MWLPVTADNRSKMSKFLNVFFFFPPKLLFHKKSIVNRFILTMDLSPSKSYCLHCSVAFRSIVTWGRTEPNTSSVLPMAGVRNERILIEKASQRQESYLSEPDVANEFVL